MASFRFCRPDDIHLLVEAINDCFVVHFPELSLMTVQAFKKEIRELDLWCSSCMVALHNKQPIGVLIVAKRETGSSILRIGMHPEHMGLEYGTHLLTSLKDKMAILGPPLLSVEIPEDQTQFISFFEKQGYHFQQSYTDFTLTRQLHPPEYSEMIIPVTLEDIENQNTVELLPNEDQLAWNRSLKTLAKQSDISGIGIPSVDGIVAFLFYRSIGHGRIEIMRMGFINKTEALWLETLLRHLSNQQNTNEARSDVSAIRPCPIDIPKLASNEIPFEILESLGFQKQLTTVKYSIETGIS